MKLALESIHGNRATVRAKRVGPFAVHPGVFPDESGRWVVTHVATGRKITTLFDSAVMAEKYAKAILKSGIDFAVTDPEYYLRRKRRFQKADLAVRTLLGIP